MRLSLEIYLSNFLRFKTSSNSNIVSLEAKILPATQTLLKARRGEELGNNKALSKWDKLNIR